MSPGERADLLVDYGSADGGAVDLMNTAENSIGNALFMATALAFIVGAAKGGQHGAILLYEAALGVTLRELLDRAGGVLLPFVLGTAIEGSAALIILTPILLPVAMSNYGIDPIQFGVMMSMTLVLGLLTPPVGTGLYIAAALSQISITRLSWLVAPYVLAAISVIVMVILIPWMVRPF